MDFNLKEKPILDGKISVFLRRFARRIRFEANSRGISLNCRLQADEVQAHIKLMTDKNDFNLLEDYEPKYILIAKLYHILGAQYGAYRLRQLEDYCLFFEQLECDNFIRERHYYELIQFLTNVFLAAFEDCAEETDR